MNKILSFFSFEGRSSRTEYAALGFASMAVKYALDVAVIYAFTQSLWMPLDYLSPLLQSKKGLPTGVQTYLLLMMIPCVWLGLAMSVKRIRDTGLNITWSFAFLIPVLNYFFMLLFCCIPGKVSVAATEEYVPEVGEKILDPKFWFGIVGSALFGCLGLWGFAQLGTYGIALFLLTPFLMGLFHGFNYGRSPNFTRRGLVVGSLAIWLISCSFFLLFALEGVVCLGMISPIAILIILFASFIGAELSRKTSVAAVHFTPLLGFAAIFGWLETTGHELPLKKVSTTLVIAAPIAVVWNNVIKFPELPEPSRFIKDSGIAYPLRARIDGEGVGATRYCEFSTGAFVEPITAWEYPTRLAFAVTQSPSPMHEWNPFHEIHPPHLDGYFLSRQGEFKLEALTSRETLIIGSTWYTLNIQPVLYWDLWAEWIVHTIHSRVLEHIKTLSEQRT